MNSVELNKMYSLLSYPGNNNHDNFFIKGVYPYIKKNEFSRILEAGCGTGTVLKDIAEMYPKSEIVGIDFTTNSLQQAQEKFLNNSNVSLKLIDLMSDQMQGLGKFDFIHCQGVLHHLDIPEQGLQNLIKCLLPNGKIYLWVYLAKGRQEITDIKELMLPFANESYDVKLKILKNLLELRTSAKQNIKHKRYLNRHSTFRIIGKLGKLLLMIEQYGFIHSLSKVRHLFLNKIFKTKNLVHQHNIGLADEYLNPNEHFYSINEIFELLNKNNLQIDFITDGISRNLNDIGTGSSYIEPELTKMDEQWKWRLIELFDQPRGIGILCSIK